MPTTLSSAPATVIKLQGHINAANAVEFQRQLSAAVSESDRHPVLVDMERVESLDSAGLMALVAAFNLAQSLDLRFSLCAMSPSIKMIFELTQLDRVFEIFDNRNAFEAVLA